MPEAKRVLNVGGGSKQIDLPDIYAGWEHVLLDINEGPSVDLVMDARDLQLCGNMALHHTFDAVYCSHNLEHYAIHDLPGVLRGLKMMLKPGGHAHVVVPDLMAVMRATIDRGLDLDDTLYANRNVGSVTVRDVIYGFGPEVERGEGWAHKTGFSGRSLNRMLAEAGFTSVRVEQRGLDLVAMAWVGERNDSIQAAVMTAPAVQRDGNKVAFGYISNGTLRQEFHASVLAAMYHDAATGKNILGEVSAHGPYIADNRNKLMVRFLNTDADWLLMFDVDIEFPPDLPARMLEVADPQERPIVGAVYFTHMEADGGKHWLPVWMEEGEHGPLSVVRHLEIGQIRDLTMTGAGCTLIHRDVLIKMREHYGADGDPWCWFGHDLIDGKRAGEDVTFCFRARALGYPIIGLTIPVQHVKTQKVGWREFITQPDVDGWMKEEEVDL